MKPTHQPEQPRAAFTPGEWTIGPVVDSCKVFSGDTVIAEAWPTTINYAEAHANARLIAQAPAMLEALQEITDEAANNLETIGLPHDKAMLMLALVDQARAIIARAKGEAGE